MKVIVLAIAIITFAHAGEMRSRLICEGVYCYRKDVITTASPRYEIKLEQIHPGQCLVDFNTSQTFKVLETEPISQKIVLALENQSGDLERIVTFYNSRDFNRGLKIVKCEDTDTQVLRDAARTSKCLNTGGKYSRKYFCEKERLKAF